MMTESTSTKKTLNHARELFWYHAGRLAYNEGKTFQDWPRVGELKKAIVKGKEVTLYPRIRYIARNAWQLGWTNAYKAFDNDMNGLTPPTQEDLTELATASLMTVPQRLATLIDQLAPIRLRALPGHFGMNDRKEVSRLIKEWAEQGIISITGTGRRRSPFVVVKNDAKETGK